MQTEHIVEITPTCKFSMTRYENIGITDVCIEYVEHSTDHWNSDSETSIDIDKEMAKKIIAFFVESFGKDVVEVEA